MATLDRKVPSPEAFLGKPWSSWIDAAKLHCSDNVDLEEAGKEGGKSREVMRLNKEERRHGSMCRPSPSPASPASHPRTLLAQVKPKACGSGHSSASSTSKPFKTPKDNLLTSSSKQHTVFPAKGSRDKPWKRAGVGCSSPKALLFLSVGGKPVSLEKIPNLVKADGTNVKMNSTTTTTVTSSSSTSSSSTTAAGSTPPLIKPFLMSKSVPPSPEKILNGKGILSATIDKKHQNGTKNSNKPYRRLSEREFDPNKHCGVLDPETKKPCTRSLTCKTHSLSHRRAVPGRRKQFDLLLAEHKAKSREKEVKEHLLTSTREILPSQPGPVQDSLPGSSGSSGPEPKVTSPAKSRPPNSVVPRPSSANSISSSTSSNHSAYTPETPLPPVGADLASRLSSDEGEMDGADESEKLDCQFSTHHPRPLAFCSFGSRLMGRGYYVFDRRWDRFRFAINSMVEKHLNSQMWKKIPPAADSPMPSPAAHISTPVPASVLQPFSNPSAVYLPSAPISSRLTSSYIMTSAMLSDAAFVASSDPRVLMSHTTAFPHVAATLSIMDSTFKAPSAVSPIPAVIPSPCHKPSKTKTSKSSKVKDLSARSDESPNAAFVASSDPRVLMSHTTAFPHVAATLSIMDSTFKAPSAVSPIPAVIPSPCHKPSKTKTSKSSKVKEDLSRSDESPSNKKRKPQPSTSSSSSSSSLSLQASLTSPPPGPHRKNCVLNASSALNSYPAAPAYASLSVHSSNNGVSPLSAKLDPSGRTSTPGGPADIARQVGTVGGSSDSCPLSVPSLALHAGDLSLASHNAVSSLPLSFDKSEGKKRKNSSASNKACKITKMPGMNSVHKKNPPSLLAPVPEPVNSTSSRQVGKNSSLALSQSSPASIPSPGHSRQKNTNRMGRIRTLP
ncbi:Ataxin-7-like protein 1 [Heterocephalus glaber]|uniref:Ataxin-7-like protein 1 n=1 Tax=Heterocephalus glaber TaxID=10181 RepID=G5BI34_HETGA|nr:Ataxin-7-like protein 1 [Heterocephalus glaber]